MLRGNQEGEQPMLFTLGPEHWLERATQTRAVASHMHDDQTKRVLLQIAVRYEWIAKRTETRIGAGCITLTPRKLPKGSRVDTRSP